MKRPRVRLDEAALKRDRLAVTRRGADGRRYATMLVDGEEVEVTVGKAALLTAGDLKHRARATVRLRVRDVVREARLSGLAASDISREVIAALRRASPPKPGRPRVNEEKLRETFESVLRFYGCSRADAFKKTAKLHGVTERKVRIAVGSK